MSCINCIDLIKYAAMSVHLCTFVAIHVHIPKLPTQHSFSTGSTIFYLNKISIGLNIIDSPQLCTLTAERFWQYDSIPTSRYVCFALFWSETERKCVQINTNKLQQCSSLAELSILVPNMMGVCPVKLKFCEI